MCESVVCYRSLSCAIALRFADSFRRILESLKCEVVRYWMTSYSATEDAHRSLAATITRSELRLLGSYTRFWFNSLFFAFCVFSKGPSVEVLMCRSCVTGVPFSATASRESVWSPQPLWSSESNSSVKCLSHAASAAVPNYCSNSQIRCPLCAKRPLLKTAS